MKDFKNNIDKMVSKILSEEIEKKSKQVFEQIDEELKGNQKKLDVAEPKGKLTAADFKKLRGAKKHKKEVEAWGDNGLVLLRFGEQIPNLQKEIGHPTVILHLIFQCSASVINRL